MADDIPRIRRNVEKMIGQNAPETDIDEYLKSEGHTPDSFRAAVKPAAPEKSLLRQGLDAYEDQLKWQRSRVIGAAAKFTDLAADMGPFGAVKRVAQAVAPETTKAVMGYRPFGVLPPLYPTGQDVRNFAYGTDGKPSLGLESRDLPGPLGRVIDEGVETAILAPAFPGGGRNVIPGFGGGSGAEAGGVLTEGSKFEPLARIFGGIVGGGAGALGQTAVNKLAVQPVKNIIGRDVEAPAARIVTRAAQNDKVPLEDLYTKPRAMGPDALPVDVGGENVRGALRGSIVAPGPARTRVQDVFEARAAGEPSRVGASIDRNISPKSLTTTVDEWIVQRNTAPKPLYEKALNVEQVWSPRIQQFLDDPLIQPGIKRGLEIQRLEALAQNRPFDPKSYGVTGFNAAGDPVIAGTPNMRLLDAAKKGIDAIIDDFRDPQTGRVVLNERGRAIDSVRKAYLAELDNLNPNYAAARAAYATPSQMKDAAELGARLFASNARPDLVAREFKRLPPDAQDAFRVGVAEHLRTVAGRSDATNVARRVGGGPDARLRLSAVLGPKEAKSILDDLAREQAYTQTDRAARMGSRTTPMAAEGMDNAVTAGGVASDVARGNYGNALMRFLRVAGGRVAEGRTGRVNDRVAQMLLAGTPEEQTQTLNALRAFMLQERVPVTRNAFAVGAGIPIGDVAIQEGRR